MNAHAEAAFRTFAGLLVAALLAGSSYAPRAPVASDPKPWPSGVKSVCLHVEQSFPDLDGPFHLPVAPWTRKVLIGAGLVVVSDGGACDANLTIAFSGKPLSRTYGVVGGGGGTQLCYWGAKIQGRITLAGPGQPTEEYPIDEAMEPPSGVSFCPETPQRAPFERVWPRGVLVRLYGLWGRGILVSALDHDEYWVNLAAVDLLETEMGTDAIPLFIGYLDRADQVGTGDPSWSRIVNVGHRVADALKDLTGEDYGEDASLWREWHARRGKK